MEQLTKAQIECLARLSEECSEVIKVCNKVLRSGWDAGDSRDPMGRTYKDNMGEELGDLLEAIKLVQRFEGVTALAPLNFYQHMKHHKQVIG